MKTELDKCMAGEWYDCHDPIFITQKGTARQKRQSLYYAYVLKQVYSASNFLIDHIIRCVLFRL